MDEQRRQGSLCRVEMLGPLRLVRADQTLTRFGTQKAAALLAYLALRPGPHPREHLLDRFWPDMDLPAGRNNLSTTLVALRRLVEPPGVRKGDVLLATNIHVGLNPAAVTSDVADFERLLADAARADTPGARTARLQAAAALYRGDLLPGVYDDWAVSESGRLQARHLEALDRLAEDLEAQSQWAEAIGMRLRRLACDPFDEEAQCRLILLQAGVGRAGAAREAYRNFTRLFQEEFGAAPPAGIRSRIEAALTGTPPTPPADPGARRAARTPTPAGPPPDTPPERRDAAAPLAAPLPLWLSRFFGREPEMTQLAGLLLRSKAAPSSPELPERTPRLVTLVGPGGTGKTRLAAEFARQTSDRTDHWCGFVPLADVTEPGRVADAVAQALRLTPSPDVPPQEQVIAFFQGRDRPGEPQAFLILDNLEHLLGGGTGGGADGTPEPVQTLIQALLAQAPGLSLLCTSRRRVGLQGERVVEVPRLPVPAESGPTEPLASLLAVPSVRLYVDRAQAVRPDFALTPTNAAAVAALCRQLEGSPLGLELAAAWVRLLPPRKMWERLTQGQEMPEGRYSGTPLRHRSLSAALEWSCRLLTPAQQALFAGLSVFQGGWTAEAAEAVCAQPEALTLLADLQDASLVSAVETADGEIRYGFLETVRSFARRRLQEQGEAEELRRRHLHYFLSLARDGHAARRGPSAGAWLDRLEAEHDNLRAALERCAADAGAASGTDGNAGMELATALRWFWATRGHVAEGRARLAAALAPPGGSPGVRARALLAVGALAWQSGAAREARPFAEEAQALLADPPDPAGLSDALWLQGSVAASLGEWDEAQDRYARSLALSQELGDTAVIQGTLGNLGHVAFCRGDRQAARALFEESLALARASGNQAQMALMLNNLGDDALVRGDLSAARALAEESLALSRALGRRNGFIVDTFTLLCLIALQDPKAMQDLGAVPGGSTDGPKEALREALALCRECGDRGRGLGLLELSARLSRSEGRPDAAARLLGAAQTLRETLGFPQAEAERAETSQEVAGAQAALGENEFRAAWNAGSHLAWEEAMEYAHGGTQAEPPESVRRVP